MHACVLTDKKTDTTETLILNPNHIWQETQYQELWRRGGGKERRTRPKQGKREGARSKILNPDPTPKS